MTLCCRRIRDTRQGAIPSMPFTKSLNFPFIPLNSLRTVIVFLASVDQVEFLLNSLSGWPVDRRSRLSSIGQDGKMCRRIASTETGSSSSLSAPMYLLSAKVVTILPVPSRTWWGPETLPRACWGKRSHQQREKVWDRFRGPCEKPGSHPDFLAFCAALEQLKRKQFGSLDAGGTVRKIRAISGDTVRRYGRTASGEDRGKLWLVAPRNQAEWKLTKQQSYRTLV